MTSSQPPQPPGGHGEHHPAGPPPYGQQPPQPPVPPPPAPPGGTPSHTQPGGPYGYPVNAAPGGPPPGSPPPHYTPPPPTSAPPPGSQPPPGYGPPPAVGYYGQSPYGVPPQAPPGAGGSGLSFDLKKLRMADYVLAGGAVLYLIFALLPWFDLSYELFGVKDSAIDLGSLTGFHSGLVATSFVLFLLAALWAWLPAVVDVKVTFPRGFITAGLAALGLVLTLIAWIRSLGGGFYVFALLGLIVAVGITLFALLSLLPELRNRPALPGALAGAAQWANQQAPDLNTAFGGRPKSGAADQPGQPGQQGYAGQPAHPPTQPFAAAPPGAPAPTSPLPAHPQSEHPEATAPPSAPPQSAPLPPPPYGQPAGTTPPETPPQTSPMGGSGATPTVGSAPDASGDGPAAHGTDAPRTDGTD